jgi:signal transduction histidine kinase
MIRWLWIAVLLLTVWQEQAHALDPTQSLAQLRHTEWTLKDGAPGNIRALAQGKDGFLWLGSSTGLYRFDGVRFDRVLPDKDNPQRSLQVTAVMAARNGDIWVGYDFGGIAVYHDGQLRDANPWRPLGGVSAIVEAPDGAIWVSAESRGKMLLSRFSNKRWTRFGAEHGLTDGMMGPVLAASDGSIYVALPPALLRLAPGSTRFSPIDRAVTSFAALAQDRTGQIWLADDYGLRHIRQNVRSSSLAPANTPYVTRHLYTDRNNNFWVTGQNSGLAYLRRGQGKIESPDTSDPLSGALSLSALEDREGNIWIGTEAGLHRFTSASLVRVEDSPVVTGFVNPRRSPHIFYAGVKGVYRIIGPHAQPKLIFSKSDIGVLCGDDRKLLAISLSGAFLLDLNPQGDLSRTTTGQGPLSVSCALDGRGQFWTGMDRLYRLTGNTLLPAAGPTGQPGGTIMMLRADGHAGLIAARSGQGLRHIDADHDTRLVPPADNVIGSVTTVMRAGSRLYIGGQKGLALLENGRTVSLTERAYPYLAGITGIMRTHDGWTWLNGATGIVRMKSDAIDDAFAHPGRSIPYQRIGHEANYRARANLFDANDIAQDSQGRLWFASNQGLAWLHPRQLTRNALPPPVVIRSLRVDGVGFAIGSGPVRLPAYSQRVRIEYTALSLTDAPENRFRYRLTGANGDWYDAGTQRQALYTNLAPGRYEFRVIASNNDGGWNRTGAALQFEIAPAFYQTRWFIGLCLIALLGAMWLLYRRRLQVVIERARSRVEVQLIERERIARELHDTLLQGFQGLMLRFQAVVELLPRGERARADLEATLDRAEEVLIESRERVHSLRQDLEPVALAGRLAAMLGDIVGDSVKWRMEEQGIVRLVCAPVADEIGWIVREALSNSLRHAQATNIIVRLSHGAENVSLAIKDDGIGLPSAVLETGMREGHYGMVGMRERARRLTGALECVSTAQMGTEIRLTVPARVAYP